MDKKEKQIIAILKVVKSGKCKNVYAALNKVKILQIRLDIQRRKEQYYKYLAM